MIPVYICDDNEKEKKHLHKMIENLILIPGYDMQVVLATGTPEEILAHRRTHTKRSVYFLDVDLNHETCNGFILAKRLRELDARGFIVFVTMHEEMMHETFQYRLEAMDYVIKEEAENLAARLRECLNDINRLIINEKDDNRSYYTVKTNGCVYHIPTEEILYFKTSGDAHRVTLHAKSRLLDFRGDLTALEKETGDAFLKVHRSYLVRKDKIRQINYGDGTLIMENGDLCLFSRQGKRLLKDYFEKKRAL